MYSYSYMMFYLYTLLVRGLLWLRKHVDSDPDTAVGVFARAAGIPQAIILLGVEGKLTVPYK